MWISRTEYVSTRSFSNRIREIVKWSTGNNKGLETESPRTCSRELLDPISIEKPTRRDSVAVPVPRNSIVSRGRNLLSGFELITIVPLLFTSLDLYASSEPRTRERDRERDREKGVLELGSPSPRVWDRYQKRATCIFRWSATPLFYGEKVSPVSVVRATR